MSLFQKSCPPVKTVPLFFLFPYQDFVQYLSPEGLEMVNYFL